MSHPDPSHDPENVYPHDDFSATGSGGKKKVASHMMSGKRADDYAKGLREKRTQESRQVYHKGKWSEGEPVRSATTKSIDRKRQKIANSMRGMYPGWSVDAKAKLHKAAQSLNKHIKHHD